jgi:ubiquinone/menaquinone biosynthesis C-methylase UbiE
MSDPEKKQTIQLNYNESAPYYDARYLKIQFQKLLILFQRIKSIQSPILDMGAGTGIFWEFLQTIDFFNNKQNQIQNDIQDWLDHEYELLIAELEEELPNFLLNPKKNYLAKINLVGIDISNEMLKIFYTRSQKKRSRNYTTQNLNIHLVCADGEHLPFRNQVFRSVFSLTAIQNLADPWLGIKELHRVSLEPTQLGITILKKKINQEDFLQAMKQYWKDFNLISPSEYNMEFEIEDWIGYL